MTQEGLGVADLARIEVRGEAIANVARRFVPYQEAAAQIVERNACTGCMGEMVSTFIYLNEAGFGDRLADLTLVLGTPDELPGMRGTPMVVGTLRLLLVKLGSSSTLGVFRKVLRELRVLRKVPRGLFAIAVSMSPAVRLTAWRSRTAPWRARRWASTARWPTRRSRHCTISDASGIHSALLIRAAPTCGA